MSHIANLQDVNCGRVQIDTSRRGRSRRSQQSEGGMGCGDGPAPQPWQRREARCCLMSADSSKHSYRAAPLCIASRIAPPLHSNHMCRRRKTASSHDETKQLLVTVLQAKNATFQCAGMGFAARNRSRKLFRVAQRQHRTCDTSRQVRRPSGWETHEQADDRR